MMMTYNLQQLRFRLKNSIAVMKEIPATNDGQAIFGGFPARVVVPGNERDGYSARFQKAICRIRSSERVN